MNKTRLITSVATKLSFILVKSAIKLTLKRSKTDLKTCINSKLEYKIESFKESFSFFQQWVSDGLDKLTCRKLVLLIFNCDINSRIHHFLTMLSFVYFNGIQWNSRLLRLCLFSGQATPEYLSESLRFPERPEDFLRIIQFLITPENWREKWFCGQLERLVRIKETSFGHLKAVFGQLWRL